MDGASLAMPVGPWGLTPGGVLAPRPGGGPVSPLALLRSLGVESLAELRQLEQGLRAQAALVGERRSRKRPPADDRREPARGALPGPIAALLGQIHTFSREHPKEGRGYFFADVDKSLLEGDSQFGLIVHGWQTEPEEIARLHHKGRRALEGAQMTLLYRLGQIDPDEHTESVGKILDRLPIMKAARAWARAGAPHALKRHVRGFVHKKAREIIRREWELQGRREPLNEDLLAAIAPERVVLVTTQFTEVIRLIAPLLGVSPENVIGSEGSLIDEHFIVEGLIKIVAPLAGIDLAWVIAEGKKIDNAEEIAVSLVRQIAPLLKNPPAELEPAMIELFKKVVGQIAPLLAVSPDKIEATPQAARAAFDFLKSHILSPTPPENGRFVLDDLWYFNVGPYKLKGIGDWAKRNGIVLNTNLCWALTDNTVQDAALLTIAPQGQRVIIDPDRKDASQSRRGNWTLYDMDPTFVRVVRRLRRDEPIGVALDLSGDGSDKRQQGGQPPAPAAEAAAAVEPAETAEPVAPTAPPPEPTTPSAGDTVAPAEVPPSVVAAAVRQPTPPPAHKGRSPKIVERRGGERDVYLRDDRAEFDTPAVVTWTDSLERAAWGVASMIPAAAIEAVRTASDGAVASAEAAGIVILAGGLYGPLNKGTVGNFLVGAAAEIGMEAVHSGGAHLGKAILKGLASGLILSVTQGVGRGRVEKRMRQIGVKNATTWTRANNFFIRVAASSTWIGALRLFGMG